MFSEDAHDKPVDSHPAIAIEQAEESLHLIEWYHMREDAHDPCLADYEDVYFVFKVLHQIRKLYFQQCLYHITV